MSRLFLSHYVNTRASEPHIRPFWPPLQPPYSRYAGPGQLSYHPKRLDCRGTLIPRDILLAAGQQFMRRVGRPQLAGREEMPVSEEVARYPVALSANRRRMAIRSSARNGFWRN